MRAITLICLAFLGTACADRTPSGEEPVVLLPPVEVVHMDQVTG